MGRIVSITQAAAIDVAAISVGGFPQETIKDVDGCGIVAVGIDIAEARTAIHVAINSRCIDILQFVKVNRDIARSASEMSIAAAEHIGCDSVRADDTAVDVDGNIVSDAALAVAAAVNVIVEVAAGDVHLNPTIDQRRVGITTHTAAKEFAVERTFLEVNEGEVGCGGIGIVHLTEGRAAVYVTIDSGIMGFVTHGDGDIAFRFRCSAIATAVDTSGHRCALDAQCAAHNVDIDIALNGIERAAATVDTVSDRTTAHIDQSIVIDTGSVTTAINVGRNAAQHVNPRIVAVRRLDGARRNRVDED